MPRPSRRRFDAAVFCSLVVLGILVYGPVFRLQPLDEDNFYILWWAHTAPWTSLLRLDPHIYPEWRPLPFQTIWLEHRLVPLEAVAIHHAVNLLIWCACAWLAYKIVARVTVSRVAGMLAAVTLLVDRRSLYALVWIAERQTSMACGFGLLAILWVVRAEGRGLTRVELTVIGLLLLASALSKEYGLAFAFAIAVYGVLHRQRELAWPAMAAAVTYGTLRMVVAAGAYAPYCEDMGFFFSAARHCIDPGSTGSLAQMAYNVAASGVGVALPGVFDELGVIALDPLRAAIGAVFLIFAGAGLLAGAPVLRLIALVPLFNAVLGFAIYRDRNLVIGASALAILTGAGLWQPFWRNTSIARPVRAAALLVVVALLCRLAIHTHRTVAGEVLDRLNSDPCESTAVERPGGREFAALVMKTYGLDTTQCQAAK